MYPQMTGKLTIPSITFKGIVVEQNRNVDPFEAFFNGGSGYTEVKRNIDAPSLTIQVDPLPAKPANFSGGVGKFNISASIDHNNVKAGEPINLRVVVGGVGNLKLIKQPTLTFPKDFDKYDPKVTDKTKLTANGVEGNMVYDFLVVPRNQGKYTIPAVAFTYYDTGANAYRTIKTQPFDITVGRATASRRLQKDFSSDEDKDIHALKLGNADLHTTKLLLWLNILGKPSHSTFCIHITTADFPATCYQQCRRSKDAWKESQPCGNTAPEESRRPDAERQTERILRRSAPRVVGLRE